MGPLELKLNVYTIKTKYHKLSETKNSENNGSNMHAHYSQVTTVAHGSFHKFMNADKTKHWLKNKILLLCYIISQLYWIS